MRYLITLVFVFSCILSQAQTIRVLDKKTGLPLDGVIVRSANFTTQTDKNGTVRLDQFQDLEEILFKLSSYLEQTISKQKIVQQGNTVQLSENPIKIDEVVVSVNRWEQSRAEVPQSVVSIPAEDVLHYNPQTTADLLSTGSGVYIQKSQMGGGSPMIRGFAANRLLIVVDGIRMNNAIYRSGNLQNVISIDANSLENTEVILGPGTVIYGSDALGGVMSFTTLKPKLSTHEGITPSGKIMTRYSSANFEKTLHATINLGGQKWAALVSSTYTDFDDLRMGSKARDEYKRPEYVLKDGFDGADHVIQNDNELIQRYTGYSQFNILGKLRYRPSDKTELILSANHSQTSDIPRYDRLIVYRNDKLRYGEWYYGPQVWSMFCGQLVLHLNSVLADKINLQTAFQKYAESRYDRAINKAGKNGRKEDLSIYSANLDLAKGLDNQNEFFYGVESYYNLISSKGTVYNLVSGNTESIPSRYPGDSDYGSLAGYISYKHRWEKLILQAGTRYTFTWMSGDFSQTDYGFPFEGFDMKNSAIIGNIGLVWHPATDWQINMDLSSGFRSPNIDDVAKVFDSEPGNVIVPNPDLEPEYTRTIDMEIKKTFADKASIEIGAFYTRLKNAMVRRDFPLNDGQDSIMYDGTLSKVEALVNADAADIYGGSVAFGYVLTTHLRTKHDFTITKGKDSDGFPVRHAPPIFGSSHLIFENNRWFADLYLMYNGEIAYEDLAPSEQDKPYMYAIDKNGNPFSPAWWTLNLKGNFKVGKHFFLSGGVENILDQGYRPYSSGMVSPGINFVISLLVQF